MNIFFAYFSIKITELLLITGKRSSFFTLLFMNTVKTIPAPAKSTQSTLLVGNHFYKMHMMPNLLKGKRLSEYLHNLLKDPDLEYKLNLLKPKKWKKHYQDDGQDLEVLYFYPDESDWARLSIISNVTGFSRCYIFVYLMLLDFGILKLPENRTKDNFSLEVGLTRLHCSILIDERDKILIRTIQT
jgi:hypothetical protein